jgi:PAS domain S-box-containing protein
MQQRGLRPRRTIGPPPGRPLGTLLIVLIILAVVAWFVTPIGRVALLAAAILAVAGVVGTLQRRLARTLHDERTQREVAEERERLLIDVLESMAEGFLSLDRGWDVLYVNSRGERILGRSREEIVGRGLWQAFPEARDTPIHDALQRAMHEHTHVELKFEHAPSGRWFEIRIDPTDQGVTVFFRDITATLRARSVAELSQRLLAEAGAALTGAHAPDAMLKALASLLVPALADAVVATLREEGGTMRRLEPIADRDEAALRAILPPGRETFALIADVATAGTTVHLPGRHGGAGPPPAVAELAGALAAAGYHDALLVGMASSGRPHGALLLLARESQRFVGDEVRLAEELAHRAGLVIDNVRLYESALLANQAKSDFLAVMSHELRTPLTTVMGYTDLLLSGLPEPLAPVAQRYVERMRMAAWHLLAIIEQILIYTRLEVGTEVVHAERVSVGDVLHDAVALIEPVAREKGIEFGFEPPATPLELETDLTKLRQILLNLLSNAIRFTDAGSVTLRVDADVRQIRFLVDDTGIGIDAEHLDRIFDPFWQVDQSATRRVGGTGLGLSVSRRLARMLGGDIACESRAGTGARFTLTLPRRNRR